MILNGNNSFIKRIETYRDYCKYPGLFGGFTFSTYRPTDLCSLITTCIGLVFHLIVTWFVGSFVGLALGSTFAGIYAFLFGSFEAFQPHPESLALSLVFCTFVLGFILLCMLFCLFIIWLLLALIDETPLGDVLSAAYDGIKNKYCPIIVYTDHK